MAVNGIGTGNKIGKRPPDEHPGSGRGCEYGKPRPFHQLTEVIGRSDVSVKPFSGKIMLRITRPAQMTYHIVGMQIDEHTRKKQNDSQQGMRFQQIGPAIGIQAFGSEIEQTACIIPFKRLKTIPIAIIATGIRLLPFSRNGKIKAR